MVNYYPLFVIGLAWLGAALIWLTGNHQKKLLHGLAIAFSALTGCASLGLFPLASSVPITRIHLGGLLGDFTLVADGLGVTIAVIAAVIGCLAVIFARDYMRHDEEQLRRFYGLILFFIGAMMGLGLSGNLLFTFFFWEITAFCSYALISFHNDGARAVAGGVKALIITQIGGVGLLVGALLLYSYQGNYQINQFLTTTGSLPSGVLSLMAFGCLIAAAAKSAQVPFHTWLPDAMEAPTPVTALIHAATMVNAGVYLLARFYTAFADVPGWRLSVMLVGAASALLAGLMAVAAQDIKRILAYSTISQLGFMVYAVGTGAIFASQFHLFSHAIFKALLFLSAGALITSLGTRDLRQMGGLGKYMPFVRLAFIIGAAGLVGLPLANGFISKDLILEGGWVGGPHWLYFVMLISAGVTALYTLRLYRLVFSGERHGPEPTHDGLPAMRVSLATLAAGTLSSWLLSGPLERLYSATMPSLHFEAESTWNVLLQILSNPATWITLAVIGMGFGFWGLRNNLSKVTGTIQPLLESELGFDWVNQQVLRLTTAMATRLQKLQTGQLNWNVAGIMLGSILLLVLLMGGR